MVAAYGMLVALVERNRSGQGQEINTSLYGSQLCMQGFGITGALWRQRNSQLRPANSSPRLATYQCSDGLLTLAGGAPDRWWPGFCEAMGVPECAEGVYTQNATDPDWCKRTYDRLNEVFATADRETWMQRLSPRFHVQPVRTYLEIGQDQQAWDNGYLMNVTNNVGETVPMVGLPVHLSRTPGSVRNLAPEKGQHTDEVLGEFGFTAEAIAGLRAAGAFGSETASK
jgi:crotonobetainyl-CoA:carnitine CoA-transferase CaiB-like acyl-CoA transferase